MKAQDQQAIQSFKEKLENEYDWPSLYTFKFIVPIDKKDEIKKIFIKHDVTEKQSSKGNYISITSKVMASSSDTIVEYYLEANKVEGVIAL
ncbi:MAG: DUF493 family protein [Fulvivirga sp.]|uniref:DUF493 family protein n=1 Tax=Fulvivirga sp. TaxID=1931237 RepID=UPI0032EE8FF3